MMMFVDPDKLMDVMTPQAREQMLLAMAKHFPNEMNNLKAIANRSKIRRLSHLPAPTNHEISEAKSGKMGNFMGLYRNRINAQLPILQQLSIADAKDVYDMIRENL